MPRIIPPLRKFVVEGVKEGKSINVLADVFNISRTTIRRWVKRAFHPGSESFEDKPRGSPERKITRDVELAVLEMRFKFGWGTAKISQGIWNLPDFMKSELDTCVQGVKLSRTAINGILKEHHLNGYKRKEQKAWKRFRARYCNELWQLDIKGPFYLFGKKYWFVVCVDDYSRYVLLTQKFENDPSTDQIIILLEPLVQEHNPQSILTDNGFQFKKTWEEWCKKHHSKALFAHPHYPQDKGKVERCIRTFGEEFINLLHKFPHWMEHLQKYVRWHNHQRFHRGINTQPAKLYVT